MRKNFKKYHSIENSYREKYIVPFLVEHPDLANTLFLAQEKIHGCNIQIKFFSDGSIRYGKRSSFVNIDEKFYNIHQVILDMDIKNTFKRIIDRAKSEDISITLYGEMFGPGIQKEIDYTVDKQTIRFFDMAINDKLLPPIEFYYYMETSNLWKWIVPLIGMFENLQDVLDCDLENSSLHNFVNRLGNKEIEGIVIKPYYKIYKNKYDNIFVLKKKSKKFAEKKKIKIPKTPVDNNIIKLNKEFINYITDSRIQNVFSKEGEIKTSKEIRKYIKLIMTDAKEDFMKDFGDEVKSLEKKELKNIFNVGSTIFLKLKSFL